MEQLDKLRKNVREIRTEKGLSRVQLAKKANLSPFTIIDLELGRNSSDIKLSTLIKLSEGLNSSVSRLLK